VAPLAFSRTPPGIASLGTEVATSSLTFHDEEGRRHRADATYLLPKDDREIRRLDYQHYIFRHILQGNAFAPVDALLQKGGKVLDVGCGTGRWGHEIASTYPRTSVIGFDLEEVLRTHSTMMLQCNRTLILLVSQ
jgi:SAM-dependent methyltransferase